MSKINVVDMAGKVVSELELNDAVFGIEPNKTAMHTAVVNYLANQRQGTQSTLTRTEVSGAARSPIVRRVRVMPVRVRQELRSGDTAVSRSVRSPVHTELL